MSRDSALPAATSETGPLVLAAIQAVSGADVEENLAVIAEQVTVAAAAGAGLVALPEFFARIGAGDGAQHSLCEAEGEGPLQDFLAALAAQHRVWLVGGSIPLQASVAGKVRNSSLVFNDRGERVARYDKIHLFSFCRGEEHYDEASTIEAGDEVCSFASPAGRTGLALCYDLRFPELFRALGEPNLVIVPAAFTYTTGRAHWEILLRARAIENQCYLLAPAQGGWHGERRRTWGHSMIIDPWGEILACRAEGAGVVLAEFEPERIERVRQSLPALRHRRVGS